MMKQPCGCGESSEEESREPLGPVEITGKVTGTMRVNPEAADYGSYSTFFFDGTATDVPQRVLNRDNDRQRAVIQVVTGSAYIGKKEQIASGVTGNGWLQTSTMQPLEVRNKQEVWVMGVAAAPCTIAVLNERWDSARTD